MQSFESVWIYSMFSTLLSADLFDNLSILIFTLNRFFLLCFLFLIFY